MNNYIKLTLHIFLYFLIFSSQAFANSENSSQALYNKYQKDLTSIENYLNNITQLSSKFLQETEESLVEGKFYLLRNNKSSGKMRVEYLADPKILIIVNGSILSYIDVELDEVSKLSTNTTPASFLTRPHISFTAKDVIITNVVKANKQLKVSVMKKNRKEAGEFSLKFNLNPIEFIAMEVKNDLEQITNVTLLNTDFKTVLPKKLFIAKTSRSSR